MIKYNLQISRKHTIKSKSLTTTNLQNPFRLFVQINAIQVLSLPRSGLFMFFRIKSQIMSITINYKNPYWTSSANLRRPEEISSNLVIYAKYEEFEET